MTTTTSAEDPANVVVVEADAAQLTGRGAATSARWFRGDVDGLRALAIVAVIGFHAYVPGFSGGFVGVDVFFVISGYLITTKLVEERDRTGRVRLGAFWAKRIRRLVPAMSAMVLTSLVLSLLVLSPREWPGTARSGAAAAGYVSNIYFATGTTTYFGTTRAEGPFLHTWSLGVEEQFYLVWPLLILVAVGVAALAGASRRRYLTVALGFVVAVSFVVSIGLTRGASQWAFFGLQSRAWQFALAGLTALTVVPARLRRAGPATAAVVLGLAMIVIAIVTFTGDDPYPGFRALVPTLGTVLVILGGEELIDGSRSAPSQVLAHPAMQRIGRVSYSWYLWHWPMMVFASALLASESPLVRLPAGALALVVAAVMYRWVENPIRFSTALRRSLPRTYLLAAVLTVTSLLAAGALGWHAQAASSWPETLALEEINQANDLICATTAAGPSGIEFCEGGALEGTRTVVLVGDSHAGHWMHAIEAAGEKIDVKVVSRWQPACPAVEVQVETPIGPDEACNRFRDDTRTLIDELEPDLVVVAESTDYGDKVLTDEQSPASRDVQVGLWRTAYERLVRSFADDGVRVVAIAGTPMRTTDPLACLGRPSGNEQRCATDRESAFAEIADFLAAEDSARRSLGVPTFDVTDEICDADRCRALDGDVPIYADMHHLTNRWTVSRQDEIAAFLDASLRAPTPERP